MIRARRNSTARPWPRASLPANQLRRGMAFCPEDRKAEGIFAELSVRENIVLGLQIEARMALAASPMQSRIGWQEMKMIKVPLGIATPDADKPARAALRGQSAVKVVLARSLVSSPSILILDEPTRGDRRRRSRRGRDADPRNLCSQGLALLVVHHPSSMSLWQSQRSDRGAARSEDGRRNSCLLTR